MLQKILDLITNPVSSSLLGAIIGFIASFFAQDWLEQRTYKRSIRIKAWETKVEKLCTFSEDLELWFYLISLKSNDLQNHNSLDGYEAYSPSRNSEIETLTKKLVRNKTHLTKYPKIYSNYEKIIDLTEWNVSIPFILKNEESESVKTLLREVQKEIRREIDKLAKL